MRDLSRTAWALLAALLLCGAADPARADDRGEEIFKNMDQALTSAEDQWFEYDFIVQKPGEPERTLVFQVTVKGTKLRRLHFLSPGDVKGMRFLVLSVTQMYVYLPAFRKVRRVASHVRDQGFMGSAHSQDALLVVTFGEYMQGKFISEDEQTFTVEGTLRKGQQFPYPKIVFTIDKKMSQPVKMLYHDDKGQHIKTETRTDWECVEDGKICNPVMMKLVDHRRNDVTTVLKRRKWKYNQNVLDKFFTVRSLQRRR